MVVVYQIVTKGNSGLFIISTIVGRYGGAGQVYLGRNGQIRNLDAWRRGVGQIAIVAMNTQGGTMIYEVIY